jgi:beta-galactosidase beta subunit
MKDKKSFILYADLIHTVVKMPKDKAGELFVTILKYVNDENPVVDDMLVDLTFEPIKQQLKRDLKYWEQVKVNRSNAGKAGGIKSGEIRSKTKQNEANVLLLQNSKQDEANASKTKQSEANEAVNVNGIVNVTVNEKKNTAPPPKPFEKEQPKSHAEYLDMLFSVPETEILSAISFQLNPRRPIDKAEGMQFNAHLTTSGKVHLTYTDYREHFRNWISKQPAPAKKPKKEEYL